MVSVLTESVLLFPIVYRWNMAYVLVNKHSYSYDKIPMENIEVITNSSYLVILDTPNF